MPGQGSGQRRLDRLLVPHLPDHNHVRALAYDMLERLREGGGVVPDLPLVNERADSVVDELDRVLDRDDVVLSRPVDLVDQRSQRRRLPTAGRPDDEEETLADPAELADDRRQVQGLELDLAVRDSASDEAELARAEEQVYPESPHAGEGVRDVDIRPGEEPLPGEGGEDLVAKAVHRLAGRGWQLAAHDAPVNAE